MLVDIYSTRGDNNKCRIIFISGEKFQDSESNTLHIEWFGYALPVKLICTLGDMIHWEIEISSKISVLRFYTAQQNKPLITKLH